MNKEINPPQGWALAADQMIEGVPGTILAYQWQQSDPLEGGSVVDTGCDRREHDARARLRLVITYPDGEGVVKNPWSPPKRP